MTKPEGINLEMRPEQIKRGASNSTRNNQRERRVNKALLGKEVIIRPEHRSNGGKARKRAVARERAEEGRVVAPTPQSPSIEPFARSGEALADLSGALGYPAALIPRVADRVYKNWEMIEPEKPKPPKKPTSGRPPHEIRRMVSGGTWERCCSTCKIWLPEAPPHYRWRNDRKHWEPECCACHNIRRKEYYEAHRA